MKIEGFAGIVWLYFNERFGKNIGIAKGKKDTFFQKNLLLKAIMVYSYNYIYTYSGKWSRLHAKYAFE